MEGGWRKTEAKLKKGEWGRERGKEKGTGRRKGKGEGKEERGKEKGNGEREREGGRGKRRESAHQGVIG